MKLVYLPTASLDKAVKDYSKNITWLQLHVLVGQEHALQSALTAWVKQLQQQDSKLQFSAYHKSIGAHVSQFVLIFHHAIQVSPNQLLPAAVLAKLSVYDVSRGVHQPAAAPGF